jgi:hypothetical protein
MRMPVRRLLAAAAGGLLVAASAAAAGHPWRDATRDVYVDGRLDRSAQVLVEEGSRRMAIVAPQLSEALLLTTAEKSFAVVPRDAFRFSADRATAELGPLDPAPGGAFQNVEKGSPILHWKGKTVLVARHQGVVGEVGEDALFQAVPVWKSLMDSYKPAPEAVAGIRDEKRAATVTAVFGSWCGDSKEFIPRLLKSLHAAGNPKLTVKLVALDNQFLQPAEVIQGRRIINVPTVVVESAGRELGRITESPAAKTMEEDLLAILRGKPNAHRGRYERGAELARGTYVYRESGRRRGEETWTLYETAGGGRLAHSRITSPDLETEVFHAIDSAGKLRFAEITKRQGEGVMRARFFMDKDTLTGRLRGKEAGILQQEVVVPGTFAFASPAIATSGWVEALSRGASSGGLVCYVAPEEFESPLGTTCVVTHRMAGEETVRVPAGEFRAARFARQSDDEQSDWWLHPRLGIPVRGRVLGGMEYELTSLEVSAGDKPQWESRPGS